MLCAASDDDDATGAKAKKQEVWWGSNNFFPFPKHSRTRVLHMHTYTHMPNLSPQQRSHPTLTPTIAPTSADLTALPPISPMSSHLRARTAR